MWRKLDKWISYSVRRSELDKGLLKLSSNMRGRVLEIGAGRGRRRGFFNPPKNQVQVWDTLDLNVMHRPHIQADIELLPLLDDSYDTVVCLEVLEYATDPLKALLEISRVLRSNGVLIISTPFLHRVDSSNDLWRFTEHGLHKLLRDSGFVDIELEPHGGALSVSVNILKYVAYVQTTGWRKRFIALLLWPILSLLWAADKTLSRMFPVLNTFSTGYILSAHNSNMVHKSDSEFTASYITKSEGS